MLRERRFGVRRSVRKPSLNDRRRFQLTIRGEDILSPAAGITLSLLIDRRRFARIGDHFLHLNDADSRTDDRQKCTRQVNSIGFELEWAGQ